MDKAEPYTAASITHLWGLAIKRPIMVRFREVCPPMGNRWGIEVVHTPEGNLLATEGRDYIIEGIEGELYPIKKRIFLDTYDIVLQT
jgi:hypothetical protein